MGNEMGNNNVSGLKEEEITAATEDRENYSLKANLVDYINGENQIVPAGEGKDFHEKVEDLSLTLSSDDPSGVGDPHEDKQTSTRKELDDESELESSVQSTEKPIESIDSACQDSAGASSKNETELKPSSESTQVLSPIESNDSAREENKTQAGFSSKDVTNLERAIEPKLEENLLGTSDHQIQKQTSPRRETEAEGVEASDSTCDTKPSFLTSEPLESAAVPQSNQHEHNEVPSKTKAEECDGSPSCQAEEEGKSLETEATQNLAPCFASDAKTDDDEEEMDLVGTSIIDINDRCEFTSKNEMESNLSNVTSTLQSSLGHKCNEEAPPETNLSGNGGSSESPRDQAISQVVSPSNSFEEVAEPQDKCMVLIEDTAIIGNLSENEETNHHSNPIHQFHEEEEAVTEMKTDDEFNASQLELVLDGSSSNSDIDHEDSQSKEVNAGGNGYQVDTFNSELKEKEDDFEKVQAEFTFPQEDHVEGEEEEEEQTEKIIEAMEEKAEILKAMEISGTEAKETTEQPIPQSHRVDYANSLFSESFSPQLMPQDTVIGSEADLKSDSCSEFIVTEASNVNSNDSEKETLVPAVGLENEKPEQDLQKFSVSETETAAEQLQPNERCAEVEIPAFTSASNEAAEESAGNHAAELRKSPSFVFDLSLDPMYEVSDQTPLLHRDKAATRSQSRSLDGAGFCNPTAESTKYGRDLVQNQAISVEEKTIKVERSDSDKSRGPFVNLLEEEDNAGAVVKSEKGAKEVAITKGRGKRKPRPSIFSTCICCAAAIN